MIEATECPCCGSREKKVFPALISAWLSEYVLNGKSRSATLNECRVCGCGYFSGRYDSAEMEKLYSGYRGEAYFQSRHKHEFWYTRKVNDAFAADPDEIERRKSFLAAVLQESRLDRQIRSILDYGGDRGQIIPEIGADRYSFDVSGAECVAGVQGIQRKEDLESYDCVMMCHVLEHVADPSGFLTDVSQHVAPGGLVLIALPCEAFSLRFIREVVPGAALYSRYLRFIQNMPWLERILDFYSTAFKVKFNCIPPLGFIKQSEHLTVFSEMAIRRMVERSGFELQGFIRKGFHAVFGSEFVCIAQKKL